MDVPEECWWGQVYKLPTRWDIAHRYAIFLCPLDVEISNDNLVRQLTRWEASELENHDPSQQIVFLWCRESFHLLYTEVKQRFVNVPFVNCARLSQCFVTLGRGTIAHSHVCWTNSFLFLFDVPFFCLSLTSWYWCHLCWAIYIDHPDNSEIPQCTAICKSQKSSKLMLMWEIEILAEYSHQMARKSRRQHIKAVIVGNSWKTLLNLSTAGKSY